jgi:cytochrome c oxidase subunit II
VLGSRALRLIIVGVVASAILIAIALALPWFPTNAAKQAHPIDTLYDVLLIVSIPMFVLVTTVVLYCVKNFRMRPGQENEDGPPIHGNTTLEIIWTAIPAIILVSLCTYSYLVLRDIERKPAQAASEMQVQVLGQQFAWQFTYPKAMTGGKTVNTDQLYLPIGRSVEFRIHARDVIHDFWVPAFRVKIDAVPGITTHYRITPTRLGAYDIVCAELCGPGHSTMRSTVHVVSPAAFQTWLTRQTQSKGVQ